MPYSAEAVANALLDLAEKSGKRVNPMQLLKLVYFSHGWHLAIAGTPLIDERIEAWPYGPVVPSLYHEFKEAGSGAIQKRASVPRWVVDPETGQQTFQFAPASIDDEGSADERQLVWAVLNKVWRVYGAFSALQLSQMTHERDGPWDVTRRKYPGVRGVDIDDELIKKDFKAKAKLNEQATDRA
jgi:uncharacterized phage-associated protein